MANNHVMEILHFADGRIGPWIENCLLCNSSDDGPVVLNHALPVVQQLAPDRFRLAVRRSLHGLARDEFDRGMNAGRTAGGLLGFRVGDRLKFLTPKPGVRSATYAVAGLAEAPDGCLDITLDRSAGSDVRLVPGRETDTCTQVMNLDAKANQTVVRHNRFQFIGRNALVLQADGVLIEYNEFLGIGARAVGINSLGGHPALGVTSRDVMIRDNVMRQTSLNPTSREAISIFQLGDPATRWNENIWIVDNQILDYSIVGLSIANATGVHITGNRFGNEVFDAYGPMVWKRPGGEEPCILHVGNAADVRFENNVIAEGRAPPQLVLETGPVDNFVHDHNTVTAPPRPFSFTAPAGPPFTAAESSGAKPNVIVILADDLGYADVGFQGCRDIPTPNLGGAHEYFPRESYTTWCKGAKERYPKRPWPEWFINITLPILRNRDPVATRRYLTDHLSSEAVDFIKRHQRDPFFLSDNGGGHPGPAYFSSNHPLRGYKGDLYEGGFRVPFVASWKGTIPSGTIYDQPVSALDISATALALAGGGPAGMQLDGVILIPHLTGQTKAPPHERLFWKHHSRGVIREGRFKLITGHPKAPRELYDLIADPAETTNVAAEKTALVQRLDAAWQGWNAGMPPPAWQKKPRATLSLPEYQGPLWPDEKAALENTTEPR